MEENNDIPFTFDQKKTILAHNWTSFTVGSKEEIDLLKEENEDLKKRLKKVEWHINILYMKAAQRNIFK